MPIMNNNQAQGNFFGAGLSSSAGSVGSAGSGMGTGTARDFGGSAVLPPVLFHNWMTGSGATLGQVLAFTSAGLTWTNSSPLPPTTGGPFVMFGGSWTPMPDCCVPPPGTPTGYVMASNGATSTWVDPRTGAFNPLIPPAGTAANAVLTLASVSPNVYLWQVPSAATSSSIPNPPSSGGPYALDVTTGSSPSWVTIPTNSASGATIPLPPTSGGPYALHADSTGVISWVTVAASSVGSHYGSVFGVTIVKNGPLLSNASVLYDDGTGNLRMVSVGSITTSVTVALPGSSPVGALSTVQLSFGAPIFDPMLAVLGGAGGGALCLTTRPVGTPISTLLIGDIL